MANGDSNLNFGPFESQQAEENPQSNEEVYLGSFSSILRENLGAYVICEFLIGTNGLERKEGYLYSGGINYITLYQPSEEQYTVCDLYSLKFVTFVDTRLRPRQDLSGSAGQSVLPPLPNPLPPGVYGQPGMSGAPAGAPRPGMGGRSYPRMNR